jgi:hypothetical protein
MLIPSRMPHHRTRHLNMESYDCVVPLGSKISAQGWVASQRVVFRSTGYQIKNCVMAAPAWSFHKAWVEPGGPIVAPRTSEIGASLSLLDALAKVPSQSDLPTFVTAYQSVRCQSDSETTARLTLEAAPQWRQ